MSSNGRVAATARSRDDRVIAWLLRGDPAIRWQTMRDVVGAPARTVERERQRVARQGWGARLLARQGDNGKWAGGGSPDSGLYTPKWISTTYTMLLLRDFGLSSNNKQARKACVLLLDRGLRKDGGVSYGRWAEWTGKGEMCITGMVLSILSYFEHVDDRVHTIARHLLEKQMPDGGWNCQGGATHSSMHTTISALEGLRLYETRVARNARAVREAQRRGREFLLAHRLFRSHRTGAVINTAFTRFAFPPRWHYDVLRALDYFQEVDVPRDPRLTDAIEIVRETRRGCGRWRLHQRYAGRAYFEMEKVDTPSRWNTLRAMRVLRWWESGE